jgi:protein involved in polysaccharide export with SLBB domain
MEAVRSLVSRLRTAQAVGRIPLGTPSSTTTRAVYPDITLEDEDAIFVPHRPSTVTIVGAVFQEGSLLWTPEGNVSSYVDGAGGLRPHANRSGMVIIRADGTVGRVGGWLGAGNVVHAGDTIVIPEDVSSVGWTRLFRDWSQIFYQLGLGTAALKILKTGL